MNILTIRSLLVFAVCLLGIVHTSSEYLVTHLAQSAQANAAVLSRASTAIRTRSAEDDIEKLHAEWSKALPFSSFAPRTFLKAGRSALALSTVVSEPEAKLELVCEALDHFTAGVQLQPASPALHIALADLHGHIPAPTRICEKFHTLPSEIFSVATARERIAHAVRLAPYSTVDSYLAAVTLVGIGDKPNALTLLRENQEINPYYTMQQRSYTYQLITSERELQLGIPRKYPEVIAWVNFFADSRPSDYRLWKRTFQVALQDAITDLKERHQRGQLSDQDFSAFIKRIASTPLARSTEAIRKELDMRLASFYRVNRLADWASILEQRSRLSRIPVRKALIADDKTPSTTQLYAWTDDHDTRRVEFDALGRSLGLFVPTGTRPHLLILESQSSGARLRSSNVGLLSSIDNVRYHTIQPRSFTYTLVDGKEILVFELPSDNFRYLKIRYLGAERQSKFQNSMQQVVQLYGESYR